MACLNAKYVFRFVNVVFLPNRVLWHCHGVLYKQLAGWMLHGQLLDHHDEFFIYRELRPVLSGVTTVEEDDLGLGGVTGRQLKQIMARAHLYIYSVLTITTLEYFCINHVMGLRIL